MDEVSITRAQLRELSKKNEDITIINHHPELHMLLVERTRRRGATGEAKWVQADGKYKPDSE